MKALLKRRHHYVYKHRRSRLRRRVTSLGVSFTILLAVSLTAAGIANARRRSLIPDTPRKKTSQTEAVPHATKSTPKKSGSSSTAPPQTSPTANPETLGATTATCSPKKTPQPMLAASNDNLLRKIAEYDAVLCSGTISSSYIFVGLPRSNAEADDLAQYISSKLSSVAAAGVTPIVLVEPTAGGQKLDLDSLQSTSSVSAFDYFLNSLKTRGVTDAQAGVWVFFPEPNLPEWSTLDPTTFKSNFTVFGMMFKQYFAGAKLSMMLDSTSYLVNNYDNAGSRISLLPYVSGIPAGLVDAFGYQGFPWTPPANEGGPSSSDAADFLKPSLAIEAANALGVKNIWLNSGTYGTFYANNNAKTVRMSAASRAKILDTIAAQAFAIQKNGFTVSVNLFSQDKSGMGEAVDWSYWPAGKAEGSEGAAIFSSFVEKLRTQGVTLGVFDTY